jgi:hypothetical protein
VTEAKLISVTVFWWNFMPGATEIATEAAEIALTYAPWLGDVPVIGRILILLSPGGGNDLKAQEELQKQADKKKQDNRTRIQRNGRYVLKASDAMNCVDKTVNSGGVLLALGKALLNTLRGVGGNAGDILTDRIFLCIEENVLRQDTPRPKHPKTVKYPRPARGHGQGRRNFWSNSSNDPAITNKISQMISSQNPNIFLALYLAELNSDSMARTTLSSADKNTLRRIMKKVRAIKIEKQRKSKK